MISRLLNWLGFGARRTPKRRQKKARAQSATAHLFEKKPDKPKSGSKQSSSPDDFNPYNTGKFDRSASWERISKNQR